MVSANVHLQGGFWVCQHAKCDVTLLNNLCWGVGCNCTLCHQLLALH